MFASLYFPKMQQKEKVIRRSRKAREIIVIVMLDSCHLQTLAEESVLSAFSKTRKNWKQMAVKVLLVLGRIDCVCDRRHNRRWVEEVMRGYTPYLKSLRAKQVAMVAHSNLAVTRFAQLLSETIDDDDVDDIDYLLSKCGLRLPKTISKNNAKEYLSTHRTALQMLSGEYSVRRFLETKTSFRRKR